MRVTGPANIKRQTNEGCGSDLAYAYLFEDLELSESQESLMKVTFDNFCAYFDADPNSEDFENLADVLSAGR